mgnify:CR=1 FL=1
MSNAMHNQYVVIGTFKGVNDDVILGYFDTLQEAQQYEQELDRNIKNCDVDSAYGQIDMVNVYQLKGVE